MEITSDLLIKSNLADAATAEKVAPGLDEACKRFGITDPVAIAQFLAQCSHESGRFKTTEEGLFYSNPERLMAIWSKRFPTLESALPYAKNPSGLANKVYADRMGNGDEASGDGYRFAGKGYIQLTGRSNYQAFSDAISDPEIMNNPKLVAEPKYAALSAAWFWESRKLNDKAQDTLAVTKVINGGTHGLDDRQSKFAQAMSVMVA